MDDYIIIIIKNNPISLLSIWITPFAQEFFDFLLDSATLQMLTNILLYFSSFNAFVNSLNVFKPLFEFLVAIFYFLIGKTIKIQCGVGLYGDENR